MRYQSIRTSVKVIDLTGKAEVTDSLGLKHPVRIGDILPIGSILIMDLDAKALLEPVTINNQYLDKSKKGESD